jgi:ribonuclease VapC
MKVLDTHALMVYLEKGPGYEKVRDILATASESGKLCLMTQVNWGEIFYQAYRARGSRQADHVMDVVATFPIELIEIDGNLARQAAIYKATKKMSYADCFSAALAKLKKAELVTGDKEFKEVANEIRIDWLP